MSHVRRLVAIFLCFIVLTAQTCENAKFSDIVSSHKAGITAQNNASEVVFVLLYADDANVSGNLGTGKSLRIHTHIDGAYHVVVAGSGLHLGNFQQSLTLLRTATHDLFKASSLAEDADEARQKTADAQTRIGTARQNLEGLFNTELALASCVGTVKFKLLFDLTSPPPPIDLTATVTKSGNTWGASCPSQSQ